MELSLKRPICFFDIESTGVNVVKDRIVEISILKIYPNGNRESRTWLVNPEMPIPPETTAIHGISDEKVANEPTFKQLAHRIHDMIKDADLAGYNSNKFDIPMLAEEFLRADQDFDFSKKRAVDVQNIFHKKEQRTLSAAYRFYCDKVLEDAHTAEADTLATYEILKSQLDRYEDLENNVDFLADYSNRFRAADFAGFIILNEENVECFSFGKYKNQAVEDVLERDPGYYGWIQNAEFPLYTKKILTTIKLRKLQA
ncbi:MAG: DNA polymerase III subunit epsilon [Owenweeksia sp.]|nr:DNA polymerase III subunit epsilon [Owenweeksia sp.]MBF97521.1 DNA polymerase III subunit epsilon [Owenweeksia sp.]HBF20105.1 DNA polymerase III subunit epsilon [Cryomorphaceae bacterium]HCQ14977.1 DNA polymerase III subunit epsilon [Cryomorphaceae bacterium]|tara:strand:- start:152 stop:919 length:768 start_codon:yes stop_codon:yes gene_type:complete